MYPDSDTSSEATATRAVVQRLLKDPTPARGTVETVSDNVQDGKLLIPYSNICGV